MSSFVRSAILLFGTAALSGCASPYAQRIGYDFREANAPGTIVLGEARISSREDLISSRARDVAWYQQRIADIEDPNKVSSTPQIFRDIQIVQAMAFAVGIKADLAAGITARRNAETDEALYKINKMKLDFAVDQLEKDIALQRAKFANQSEPVNTGLGVAPGSANTTSSPTVSAIDQLTAAVDNLKEAVATGLAADGKEPLPTSVKSNPLEDFRDRLATREAYQSALNAANLDQLHDAGNARLMRLNTEIEVIPVKNYLRSLGAIEVRVVPPRTGSLTTSMLEKWLEFLNTDVKYRQSGMIRPHHDIEDLLASGRFQNVLVGTVELVLPVVHGSGNAIWEPKDVIERSLWGNDAAADAALFDPALGLLSGVDTARSAAVIDAICTNGTETQDVMAVERALIAARDRELTAGYFRLGHKVSRDTTLISPWTDAIAANLERAQRYAASVSEMMRRNPACTTHLDALLAIPEWKAFRDIPEGDAGRTRIYQVGPRELAQQVSTVARNANSLALALSASGSAPGSGVAADAAASYSREALGRASALERVPLLSGYAIGGQPAFRWVIGPRAMLDPKGRIEMEQAKAKYDVWVDLSVPGWWAGFDLEAVSVWAPSPKNIATGSLKDIPEATKQYVSVPLVRTASDHAALTELILGNLERRLEITGVEGGPVNACTPTTLWVQGDSLWRAESVFVMGQLLKREAFSATSDMRGLYITVPAITAPPGINLSRTLMVMTPSGSVTWNQAVPYLGTPSGDGCRHKPEATAAASADAATIGDIKPALEFVVPGRFNLYVSGTNLKKVARVELHGQAGTLKVAADGKSMEVAFDENMTSSVPGSDNSVLEFLDSNRKSLALKRVRTLRVN